MKRLQNINFRDGKHEKLLLHDYSGQKCINIGIKLKVMPQINFILNSQRIAGSKQTIDQEIVCHFPDNNRRTTRIPDFRVKIQQIQFFFRSGKHEK